MCKNVGSFTYKCRFQAALGKSEDPGPAFPRCKEGLGGCFLHDIQHNFLFCFPSFLLLSSSFPFSFLPSLLPSFLPFFKKSFLFFTYLVFKFTGVTLVNKIIQVSSVQFHNTSSIYHVVCSPPSQLSFHHHIFDHLSPFPFGDH